MFNSRKRKIDFRECQTSPRLFGNNIAVVVVFGGAALAKMDETVDLFPKANAILEGDLATPMPE